MGGTVPGRADVPAPMDESEQIRVQQDAINEATFSNLNIQYDQAQRDVNFLGQALERAQVREKVLGAAMNVLNAPQQAPSLRSA